MKHPIDVAHLAELLAKCPAVTRHDSEGNPEAWALAFALNYISGAAEIIASKLMPALTSATEEQSIEDIIHDIGEEFRLILLYLNNSRFYGYIRE